MNLQLEKELEHERNRNLYRVEKEMYETQQLLKYQKINLYLFILYYITLAVIGVLVVIKPGGYSWFMKLGIILVLFLYPVWIHYVGRWVFEIVQTIGRGLYTFLK